MQNKRSNDLLRKVIIGLFLPGLLLATGIRIAPNVLNLGSNGTVVTVHTELPFSSVIAASVSLNGIDIQSWKADARGNFVAKFSLDEVKSLFTSGTLEMGEVLLTIQGETTSGPFSGSATISVIDR